MSSDSGFWFIPDLILGIAIMNLENHSCPPHKGEYSHWAIVILQYNVSQSLFDSELAELECVLATPPQDLEWIPGRKYRIFEDFES